MPRQHFDCEHTRRLLTALRNHPDTLMRLYGVAVESAQRAPPVEDPIGPGAPLPDATPPERTRREHGRREPRRIRVFSARPRRSLLRDRDLGD